MSTSLQQENQRVKIINKLERLSVDLDKKHIKLDDIVNKLYRQMADNMTGNEIDELVEDIACHLTSKHWQYGTLASRIAIDRMQNKISKKRTFSETIQLMRDNVDKRTGKAAPIIGDSVYKFIMQNKEILDKAIHHERDFLYDRFGFKTLYLQHYLARVNGKVVESPQYMHMRIACGIWWGDASASPLSPPSPSNETKTIKGEEVETEIKTETEAEAEKQGGSRGDAGPPDAGPPDAEDEKEPSKMTDAQIIEKYGKHFGKDAVAIFKIIVTYKNFSLLKYTHGSPTLFNSGRPNPQFASCFLLDMKDDSIEGIYETLKMVAKISKNAGGVGLDITKIRASGSYIKGSDGKSNGLVPMLRVYNETARYVDQGGGKRKGSFAMYLQPWHADTEVFLDARKNHGKEEERARDLFLGFWIPNLFMRRLEQDGDWTYMCPEECPGLVETFGQEFEDLYCFYERTGKGRRTIKARTLWYKMVESQTETGNPYMLYKDACNTKSTQRHLGVIKSSNLCTEVILYTDPDEVAVCTLASVALPRFVLRGTPPLNPPWLSSVGALTLPHTPQGGKPPLNPPLSSSPHTQRKSEDKKCDKKPGGLGGAQHPLFDFEGLAETVKLMIENLDRIIDINYYPVDEAKNSNLKHRPLGIGTQGFADLCIMLNIPFESDEARLLNVRIFETILFAAYQASSKLAKEKGVHQSYKGSPISQGMLHPDMWFEGGPIFFKDFAEKKEQYQSYFAELRKIHDERFIVKGFGTTDEMKTFGQLEPMWDWESLRKTIAETGVRNSTLVAQMPTGTTSQILSNSESIDAIQSNIFVRRTLSGEYVVASKWLQNTLIDQGLWTDEMRNQLVSDNGSVANNRLIPQSVKNVFKTTWEMSQKTIISMSSERAPFICQSQSLNIHMRNPNYQKVTSMHFYSWRLGLKTGMYYFRTLAAVDSIKFTVDKSILSPAEEVKNNSKEEKVNLSIREPDGKPLTVFTDENINKSEVSEEDELLMEEKLLCSRTNRDACKMCSS
jgi:ribonucleoside-diphosphate reductase alpha subunit